MAQRLTRNERKERTRAEIVAAARRVFLRRGFHEASLEEITEEAGYTKGAVYSNFQGKDDLFLAVLDEHVDQRARAQAQVALDADTLEASFRAVARDLVQAARQDPDWAPLLLEFWTHASRREPLRQQALRRRERMLDAIVAILDQLAARHHVTFRIPARELARGASALARGMQLDRLLDPTAFPVELFEELFLTHVMGLTVDTPALGERSQS